MREKKFLLLLVLLAFGLLFVSACSEENGDTYYIDEPLEIGEITLVDEIAHNQRLKLVPSIKNVTGAAAYSWSATCGSFDDANSPAPFYIAPEKSGDCFIALEVVKGGKSTIKSDSIKIDTPATGYPVLAKIDGLSGAPLAKMGASAVIFAANQGDGCRLYKLVAAGDDVTIDGTASSVIDDDVHLLAANSSNKIAVLTSGISEARKVLLFDGSALSAPAAILGNYPISGAGEPLQDGEAAFALTDNYLIVGSSSNDEANQSHLEIYSLASPYDKAHIAVPQELGSLISTAAQNVGGTTFLILGGSLGTAVYRIVTAPGLNIDLIVHSDDKPSRFIKWDGTYAVESKQNDAEVKFWKWDGTDGALAIGSVDAPNGGDTSSVRALTLDTANNKAYVVSFYGGNVYEVDLTALTASGNLPKRLKFTYPMHIGEGFAAWAVEKVAVSATDYYVLTGGYYPSLGLDAPGVALIFKNAYPNIALGADPVAAIYFGSLARMLKTIDDGGGNYFYIAKESAATKLVAKKII
ncbi:MAG: hypothetical protein LBD73_00990 [Deferribacteraceae bacterium]|nr:hypothetical protein [Deferribacteraceae bacterium]